MLRYAAQRTALREATRHSGDAMQCDAMRCYTQAVVHKCVRALRARGTRVAERSHRPLALGPAFFSVGIRIASHRLASHRIASHRSAAHRIAAHRIASHRIAAQRSA
jgi:hypothetical protein